MITGLCADSFAVKNLEVPIT